MNTTVADATISRSLLPLLLCLGAQFSLPCARSLRSQYNNCAGGACNYCSLCTDGTISFGAQSSCSMCPPGTHSNAARSACVQCEAGTASLGGETSCTPCSDPGEFSATPGVSVCSIAPQGYEVTSTDGTRTGVSPCPTGSFSSGAVDVCSTCPADSFQLNTGQSSCSSCSLCAVGSYISSTCSSTSDTECDPCKAGKVGNGTGDSCDTCEAGSYSTVGSGFCATVEAGEEVVKDGELRIGTSLAPTRNLNRDSAQAFD